jgi:hypothetical protein
MIRNASLDFPSKWSVPLHRIGENFDGSLWIGFGVAWAVSVATPAVARLCRRGGQFGAFGVRRRAGSGDELLHWSTASVNAAFYDNARANASAGAGWSNHGGLDDGWDE